MGTKKKESNKTTLEFKKIDKKTFTRIDEKFREYWRYLFRLIFIYIICYGVWRWVASEFLEKEGWNKENWFLVLSIALLWGLLFSLDGWVTALLKSPFNQMCFTINKTEGISDKKKDYIITKATESNEHCKETLKKFGILTIGVEIVRVFLKNDHAGDKSLGTFGDLLAISYLIPIFFAALDIWLIHKELKKIKKTIKSEHGK